ncbi:MAG: sterol desaturase family protein [Pseudomonadales bacterium]
MIKLASIIVFPLTIGTALITTWAGFAIFELPHALAAGLSVLVFGFVWIAILERLLPYRPAWNNSDSDILTDIIHIIVDNGIIVTLEKPVLVALLVGISGWLSARFGAALWPGDWPLLAQLFLMLLIAEFGRYWIHYAAHKVPWLWRLHAVHHSPNRLYLLNAARFHPVEKILFQLPEVVPFILLGTNIETITLYLTFNSIHGLFQHSNIHLRLGWLNYIFSMTELHRWHHSKLPDESDRNFGNNLIIWDILFGTFYWPRNREVGDIGLLSAEYPKTYLGQIKAPFAERDISKPPGWKNN